MCGICGVAGHITEKEMEAFSDLLLMNGTRGNTATGVFSTRSTKKGKTKAYFAKAADDPFTFMRSRLYKTIASLNEEFGHPHFFVGHTRSPTQGGVSDLNAHPFDHPNVIGVHNGNINGGLDDRNKFSVDSDCLYHNISTKGLSKALEDLHFDSAYALVYYDKLNNSLEFVRNDRRPLFLMETNDGSTLFWSSEEPMLKIVENKLGLKVSKEPYVLPVDNNYSHQLGQNFPRDRKITYVGKPTYTYNSRNYNKNAYYDDYRDYLTKRESTRSEVSNYEPVHSVTGGLLLTDVHFQKTIAKGCCWCGSVPEKSTYKETHWVDKHNFVCADCKNDETVKQFIETGK